MITADFLRDLSEAELRALVCELEERAEQFGANVRMQVNDELRRRRMPLVGEGRWRR